MILSLVTIRRCRRATAGAPGRRIDKALSPVIGSDPGPDEAIGFCTRSHPSDNKSPPLFATGVLSDAMEVTLGRGPSHEWRGDDVDGLVPLCSNVSFAKHNANSLARRVGVGVLEYFLGDIMYRLVTFAASTLFVAVPLSAQPNEMRASLTGNGNPAEGRCLIEVAFAGAADVEIRGDNAVFRNRPGQTAEGRRFECTAPIPDVPLDLRVRSISGRGAVQLIRDQNNGAIVVRIDGASGAPDRQTLELAWTAERGRSDDREAGRGGSGIGSNSDSNQRRDIANQSERMLGAFSTEEAIRDCQRLVQEQAAARLGAGDFEFRNSGFDNAPERHDVVMGNFAFFGRDRTEVLYRFSCAVDFNARRIRSVQFDQATGDRYATQPPRVPSHAEAALGTCQDAIQAQLDRSGYDRVEFTSIDHDRRSGRADWIVGNVRAERGKLSTRLTFSCRMNPTNGSVRSINVTRR